jgi:hypothetical protein
MTLYRGTIAYDDEPRKRSDNRKRSEYLRAWRERNREHVKEYAREYMRKYRTSWVRNLREPSPRALYMRKWRAKRKAQGLAV